MRITAKPIMIGVPAVMFTVLVAVLALWAWGPIGASGGGPSSNATLVWNVEYWHRNGDGVLLDHQIKHNVLVEDGLQAAMARMIDDSVSITAEDDTFDQIVLLDTIVPVGDIEGGGPSAVLAAQVLEDVGGNAGSSAAPAGGFLNPADGEFTDDPGEDGKGKVTVTFLGEDNGSDSTGPVAARQMLLVKAAERDTATLGTADIAEADIMATIEITVDLAETDTLQIAWTIDVDAG